MPPLRSKTGRLAGTAPPETLSAATPKPLAWPHQQVTAEQAKTPPLESVHERVRWPQGSLDWLLAISDLPADPIPLPPAGAGGLAESGQLILFGGSLVNTATAAAVVTLRDGMDATGGFLCQVTVPAAGNALLALPRAGVIVEAGLWVTVTGGNATGSLFVAHVWKYPFTPPGE